MTDSDTDVDTVDLTGDVFVTENELMYAAVDKMIEYMRSEATSEFDVERYDNGCHVYAMFVIKGRLCCKMFQFKLAYPGPDQETYINWVGHDVLIPLTASDEKLQFFARFVMMKSLEDVVRA